jgi:CARDB
MNRGGRRPGFALAAGMVGLLAIPAAGQASSRPRPDLTVSRGTVRSVNRRLSGSFTIRNVGDKSADRSSAALSVTVAHRRRVIKHFRVRSLGSLSSKTVTVSLKLPARLPAGSLPLTVCADSNHTIGESSEGNNCRRVGSIAVVGPGAPSSVPTDPAPFDEDSVFTLDTPLSNYWIYVPTTYDATNQTPMTLFVWLHGCGGESSGDIYTVSPGGDQDWISIAVGGAEDACWDPGGDQAKVLAAIASVKTHFNISPRQVIIGGYSSGGDLAYRTAFYNANMFAGLLAENTSPFRDTGSSQSQSLAAAAWKFNIVHLAHTSDETYGIDGVKHEVGAVKAAGFPVTFIERPGTHSDDHTDSDLRTYLLPHIDDGWLSP